MFGLHQLAPHQLVGRDRLNVELDVLLRQPRAQRLEIVGKVVEDSQVRSQRVYRHARVGRERAQVLHHLGLHRNLILGQRIERVDDDGGDVARGSGRIFGAIGEDARRDRLACRLGGSPGANAEPSNLKNATGCGLPFCTMAISLWLEIGDRLTSLVGRNNRELNQRRSGPENRDGFLLRGKASWPQRSQ